LYSQLHIDNGRCSVTEEQYRNEISDTLLFLRNSMGSGHGFLFGYFSLVPVDGDNGAKCIW